MFLSCYRFSPKFYSQVFQSAFLQYSSHSAHSSATWELIEPKQGSCISLFWKRSSFLGFCPMWRELNHFCIWVFFIFKDKRVFLVSLCTITNELSEFLCLCTVKIVLKNNNPFCRESDSEISIWSFCGPFPPKTGCKFSNLEENKGFLVLKDIIPINLESTTCIHSCSLGIVANNVSIANHRVNTNWKFSGANLQFTCSLGILLHLF